MKNNLLLLIAILFFPSSLWSQADKVFEKGEELFQKRDYTAAYNTFEKAYLTFKESGKNEESLKALFQMGRSLTHTAKWEESLKIFEQLEFESRNSNDYERLGESLGAQTSILLFLKRNETIERKAMEILALESISFSLHSDAYQVLSRLQSSDGNLEKAAIFLNKSYQIDSLYRDSSSLPFVIGELAKNNTNRGKYNEAIKLYLKAIEFVPTRDSFKLPSLYSQLGLLFLDIGSTKKAGIYLDEATKLATHFGYKGILSKCFFFKGHLQKDEGNYTLAKEIYKESLTEFQNQDNKQFEYYALNGLAHIALKENDFNSAQENLTRAEQVLNKMDGKSLEKIHINNFLAYHLKKGELNKAAPYLEQALATVDQFKNIFYQIRTYRLASELSSKQEDYKNAFLYQQKHQILRDSLFQIQKAYTLFDMEAKYQKANQDLAISELNIENDKKESLLSRKNRTILFGGLGLFTLGAFGAMAFYLYRTKRKIASELAEKNTIISSALADKELLLREIHHRVKNNLQVISSLLRLQSKYIKDDNALSAINEGRNRVQSMALIHQNLYQEDNLMGIQIKDYFEKLILSLFDSYKVSESRIALDIEIDPLTLDVDTVVPLGLVVNELVSNTFKHAFPDNRTGRISVSLKETTDQKLKLTINDDGIGIKEIEVDTNKDSFGYKMIRAFQTKLEAEMNISSNNGTTVELLISDFKKVG